MSRLPRFFLPGTPLHVIQRGNNRNPIFCRPEDLHFYRRCLWHGVREHGVAIHAYVFMTNHVHLLVTPHAETSLPKLVQAIGRVYVQYFNRTYGRTGTLWEGRYKAAIVEDERYVLTCMRYIELNPVRANMVANPAEYPWSSFHANAGKAADDLVVPHRAHLALGYSREARRSAYRALFDETIPADDLRFIRDATQNAWALGSVAFQMRISALTRRAQRLPRGRRPASGARAKEFESDPN